MYIDKIRTNLLQYYVAGELTSPFVVMEIVNKHQPEFGLNYDEWALVTGFITEIENANNIAAVTRIANKYGLELNFE